MNQGINSTLQVNQVQQQMANKARPIDSSMESKTAPDEGKISAKLSNNIQRTLLVVDDLRQRTVNTLEALSELNKEDQKKLIGLDAKLGQLIVSSQQILDATTDAGPGSADQYIETLNKTVKLLGDLKDTKVKGTTLQLWLAKLQEERGRRLLIDKEVIKIIRDTSDHLGSPLGNFLKENYRAIKDSELKDEGQKLFRGLLSGRSAILGDIVHRIFTEVNKNGLITNAFKNLKDRIFGPKDEVDKLGSQLNVKRGLKDIDNNNSSSPSVIQDVIKDQTDKQEAQQAEVIKTLDKIYDVDKEGFKKLEDKSNGSSGMLMSFGKSLLSGIKSIGPLLMSGLRLLIAPIGAALSGLGATIAAAFSSPAVLGAMIVAVTGALAVKAGSMIGDYFNKEKEENQANYDKLMHKDRMILTPDQEKKMGIRPKVEAPPKPGKIDKIIEPPRAKLQSAPEPKKETIDKTANVPVLNINKDVEKLEQTMKEFTKRMEKLDSNRDQRQSGQARKLPEVPSTATDMGLLNLNHGTF